MAIALVSKIPKSVTNLASIILKVNIANNVPKDTSGRQLMEANVNVSLLNKNL
jgi:hypothetical protein